MIYLKNGPTTSCTNVGTKKGKIKYLKMPVILFRQIKPIIVECCRKKSCYKQM